MAFRVVFCGTPDFAVPALKTLVESGEFEVVQVFSQPDRPAGRGKKLRTSAVKSFAESQRLPVATPQSCKSPEVIDQLVKLNADIGVVVAYGQLLPQAFFDSFKKGCVNIHGSLLPRWRGAAPIQRSIMAGDSETGVSLQVMELALDAGAIIGERKIPLTDDIGSKELYEKLSALGAEMLTAELVEFLNGQRQPLPQDESLVTYAKKIPKEEGLIQWALSSRELHNKVRGLNAGGPFATTQFRDKQLKLHKTKVAEGSGEPGQIIAIDKNDFTVACGQGALQILELQPESKSKMTAGDFIRGFQISEGEKLG